MRGLGGLVERFCFWKASIITHREAVQTSSSTNKKDRQGLKSNTGQKAKEKMPKKEGQMEHTWSFWSRQLDQAPEL
jgi:hypothetical protein